MIIEVKRKSVSWKFESDISVTVIIRNMQFKWEINYMNSFRFMKVFIKSKFYVLF